MSPILADLSVLVAQHPVAQHPVACFAAYNLFCLISAKLAPVPALPMMWVTGDFALLALSVA